MAAARDPAVLDKAGRARLLFKIADSDAEFAQIHALNYATFVEEIPQHEANPDRLLVDRFHAENAYFIALDGKRVVGMLCARDRRPFSLDLKLPGLDRFLPAARRICEIRLLAIDPAARGGMVLIGLGRLLYAYFTDRGYDLAIISGTTRQQRLYRRVGFVPFGPLVGTGEAQFQPMYLTRETVAGSQRIRRAVFSRRAAAPGK